MGLSEREQRVLQELDRQLSEQDRQLARALTTGRARRPHRWVWMWAATIPAVLAVVLIVVGLAQSQAVPIAIGAVLLVANATAVLLVYEWGRRADRC